MSRLQCTPAVSQAAPRSAVTLRRKVRAALVGAVSALAFTLAACSTPAQVAPPQLGAPTSASSGSSTAASTATTSGASTAATPSSSAATTTGATTSTGTTSGTPAPTTSAATTAASGPAQAVGLELPAPTSFDAASKRFNSSKPVKADKFTDSTGSVYCDFSVPENLVCQIGAGALPLPSANYCPDPATQVRAIAFKGADVPEIRCTPPNAAPNPAPIKLDFGDSSETENLQVNCVSESFGVICVDFVTKHGFFLSDVGYKTF